MSGVRGWQFFMHPGPTNIPQRVLQAMARPALDFTGSEFVALRDACLERLKRILKTERAAVVAYAASGNGAWEASIANLFSPGERVVVCESGYFSRNWAATAEAFGLQVEILPTPEREAVDVRALGARLARDDGHTIKAVLLVHNETSTGMRHPVAEARAAIDAAGHPALFLVDTISSLASYDFRMDEWKVDLAVGGGQKGLMLPPGLSFTAASDKALAAAQAARNPRRYFDWRNMVKDARQVSFVGTAPMHFFFGLAAALDMLEEEGLENVFARHRRLAQATRACVDAWAAGGGPEVFPRQRAFASDSLTAVLMPQGHDADRVRSIAEARYGVALGRGLTTLQGRVFRIGHMGDLNEPMLLGALAAIELALRDAGVPYGHGGLEAAQAALGARAAR
ncbi:MAG: aminotransferase class V-fold PLP-dependent enzyme [Betaproteobacteria bacterium]|nr:aminotransferase class V-fold PLP-dependent enzyme [Betaproteobacteria bacterium]